MVLVQRWTSGQDKRARVRAFVITKNILEKFGGVLHNFKECDTSVIGAVARLHADDCRRTEAIWNDDILKVRLGKEDLWFNRKKG